MKKLNVIIAAVILISFATLSFVTSLPFMFEDNVLDAGLISPTTPYTLDIPDNSTVNETINETLEINTIDGLEITGPSNAFTGEDVNFTITLDGAPIQAKVIFGDDLFINWSNSTTGIVRFTMPSSIGDKEYALKASIPGGTGWVYAYHSIHAKKL